MADTVRLFVYGTLRRPTGGPPADSYYHERIASAIVSAEAARLPNAVLWDFGAYPGVAPGDSTVIGDLFEMNQEALAITDQIEDHPNFYTRRVEAVEIRDERTVDAWVYWAPPAMLASAARIESGDWYNRPPRQTPAMIEEQLADDRSRLSEET